MTIREEARERRSRTGGSRRCTAKGCIPTVRRHPASHCGPARASSRTASGFQVKDDRGWGSAVARTRGSLRVTGNRSMTGLVIAAVIAAGAVSTTTASALPAAATTRAPATGAAPGAPGVDEQYLPADKSGFGTARTAASKVWFTVQKEGGLGEIYFPTIDAPAARALQFVVSDGHGHGVRAESAADVRTTLTDSHSLSYRQTFTERGGAWRLKAAYASDPARATVLVD